MAVELGLTTANFIDTIIPIEALSLNPGVATLLATGPGVVESSS